jgi:hypothetical protein
MMLHSLEVKQAAELEVSAQQQMVKEGSYQLRAEPSEL